MAASMSIQQSESAVTQAAEAQAFLSSISTRNDEHSPLLRLPGEVRNRIFGYVFTSSPYKLYQDTYQFSLDPQVHLANKSVGMNLLRVCRKLHHETALLPFHLGQIHFKHAITLYRLPQLFSPAQRDAMHKLSFEERLGHSPSVDDLVTTAYRGNILLSRILPNLERVVVVGRSPNDYPLWMGFQRLSPMARIRTLLASQKRLEDWLRDGSKEGFEVVFEGYYVEG